MDIEPMTDDEVAEVEAAYAANPLAIDPERDQRQRQFVERLRVQWNRRIAARLLALIDALDLEAGS